MRNDLQRLVFVAVLALTGCGTIDPEQYHCEQAVGEDYFPLVDHVKWTYDVSDAARDVSLGEKRNRILERNDSTIKLEVSGVLRPGVRWLRADGSRYEWLRNLYGDQETGEPASDQYYEPPALRFDWSHVDMDESWQETYQKTTIDIANCPGWSESLGSLNLSICPAAAITTKTVTETWKVKAPEKTALSAVQADLEPGRAVTGVPAGNFPVLCQERTCDAPGCISGTYCFSRGVGKVFELSSEREELTSVCFSGHATP